MSDDVEREDAILGTALSRAIESQAVRETPFERSRLAERIVRPSRNVLAPVLATAAALALGLAIGATLLGQRGSETGPVATEPVATASPTQAAAATASPIAVPPDRDRIWVYFARDQLPPSGAFIGGIFDGSRAESRIDSRISELRRASSAEIPPGTLNLIPLLGTTQQTSPGTTQGTFEMSTRVAGDVATVEFGPGHFSRVRGSAQSQALLQQLVYTITEEPGIGRALIKERGKPNAVIDQLVIDKPLAREDVFGYGFAKPAERIVSSESAVFSALDSSTSVDTFAPGLARLRLRLMPTGSASDPRTAADASWTPSFTAEIQEKPAADPSAGKWVLRVFVENGRDPRASASPPIERIDQSPIRDLRVVAEPNGTSYLIGLEDARPWRVSVRPTAPVQIFVDIGGHPGAVSDSVAVYLPRPGDATGRDIAMQGAARAFEASVLWRIRDADEKVVASGHMTATIGTSAVWGNFTGSPTIPPGVESVTLEVFWPSPRDGSDMGLVRIPLRVR